MSGATLLKAQNRPYFENGEAQIVPAFTSQKSWNDLCKQNLILTETEN